MRQFLDRRGDLSADARRELAEELERRLRTSLVAFFGYARWDERDQA